jgi:hypothetical protein
MRVTEECAYCGGAASHGEGDHVTARCWFPSVPENELIAVPSCKSCNDSFAKDDQYFMNLIEVDSRTELHPVGRSIVEKARATRVASFGTPYGERLKGQVKVLPQIVNGVLVEGYWAPEKERLAATSRRVLRGMYYHHFGLRVPDTHGVFCAPVPAPRERDASTNEIFKVIEQAEVRLHLETGFRQGRLHKACQGAFTYRCTVLASDPHESGWLFEFYGGLELRGAVAPRGNIMLTGKAKAATTGRRYPRITYRLKG